MLSLFFAVMVFSPSANAVNIGSEERYKIFASQVEEFFFFFLMSCFFETFGGLLVETTVSQIKTVRVLT